MQFLLLGVLGAATGMVMRRIVLLRRCGVAPAARRIYLRAAWLLGGSCYVAMAVQELILLAAGQLTWRNALPLHLCSLMGLLTLPMLLTRRRLWWSVCLFLGIPGALMALLFPAVLDTPWPRLTQASFHLMHCCVLLAPLLPLSLGLRPRTTDAAAAGAFLLLTACVAAGVNALTGGNYLFLRQAPIAWMNRWGTGAWQGFIALAAAGVLAAEALLWKKLK